MKNILLKTVMVLFLTGATCLNAGLRDKVDKFNQTKTVWQGEEPGSASSPTLVFPNTSLSGSSEPVLAVRSGAHGPTDNGKDQENEDRNFHGVRKFLKKFWGKHIAPNKDEPEEDGYVWDDKKKEYVPTFPDSDEVLDSYCRNDYETYRDNYATAGYINPAALAWSQLSPTCQDWFGPQPKYNKGLWDNAIDDCLANVATLNNKYGRTLSIAELTTLLSYDCVKVLKFNPSK